MVRGVISFYFVGGPGAVPPTGVQGAEPLGGDQEAPWSPSVFDMLKVFLTCIFVGNMMKFQNNCIMF